MSSFSIPKFNTEEFEQYVSLAKVESKIKRVYEDDNFIIDICNTNKGPMVRVSVFDDGHWLDETYINKSDYLD